MIDQSVREFINRLGFVFDKRLFDLVEKLSPAHPSYKVIADLFTDNLSSYSSSDYRYDVRYYTQFFVNSIKQNLYKANQSFQNAIRDGFINPGNRLANPHMKVFNEEKSYLNTYTFFDSIEFVLDEIEESFQIDFTLAINNTGLEDEENHQEIVEKLINKRNNEVEIELLNKLRETNPIFFEKLVVKLLDTMGYSGKNGNVKVTTQSNDGGIDGIINQDPLGTSTVYLQVKRYAEKNVVGRPAIQAFYGALASVNADRGVFITTSSFSKGAEEFARNQGIVLIDGIQLTELMIEYKVGVEPAQEYVVYLINYDDFEFEE